MSPNRTEIKILLLEDDPDLVEFLGLILAETGAGFHITHALRLADALLCLSSAAFDVVLLDLGLEDSQGIDTLIRLYAQAPAMPIVVLTGQNDLELDTRLFQEGAQDYLIKGQVDGPTLLRSMRYAIERKRIEEELRESELRYRILVEHMPAITYTATPDGDSSTLYISPQIEAALGFTQAEWIADGQLWFKQIHPDDRAQVLADTEMARTKGTPISTEYRMLTRTGHVRWFHDTAAIVRDHAGRPQFLQGVWLDVTQRKQAVESLRESEERFRGAFDNAPIGMALVGLDGRWLQVNRSLCEIVGYTEQELLATTFQALTHPDDLEADLALVQQLLDREIRSYQMEKRYLHKLGYAVWVLLSVSLVCDAQGNPLYFISQMINITESRQAKELLRESEERFHDAFDHAPIGMALVGLDGSSLQVNRSLCEMLGYTEQELLATTFRALTHPDDIAADLVRRRSAQAGESYVHQLEKRYIHKNGSIIWVQLSSFLARDVHGDSLYFISQMINITESRQAEQALRESEERFRDAFDYAATGMALVGLDGRYLQVNRSLCEMLGYTEQELLATTFQTLTHPDDIAADLVRMQRAQAGESYSHQAEKRYIHKNGGVIWVHLTSFLVHDAQGDPMYFISQFMNITESRQAEQALRESEARYRTLVEKLPLSVYEIGRDGRLLSINQTGLQMIGEQHVEQALGRAYQDMLPMAQQVDLTALIARAYAGEDLQIESTGSVNGVSRVFTTTLIPQWDVDGSVSKLVGTTQDITEQLRVRLEAEQDRDRLDAILESSNDAIIMIDMEGRIALVNRACCIFFAIEPDYAFGLSGERLLSERWDYFEQPRQFQAVVEPLLHDQRREVAGEVTLLRPTKRMLVWYSGPVRTRAETVLGRLFIFRDASREKEADQMKAEFISIVSHELRTPLTSIKGFTDLILEGDAGEISAELREFLEIVKMSADQLVEITDDILEASRIESGKIKLELQPVQLDEVAHAVGLSIQMMIHAKEQQLTVDLSAELPEVYADRERLAQIFTNLMSNAHKYTPVGGRINVGAQIVDTPAAAHMAHDATHGPWMVVSVSDNGIGIAPEDQQHLFTRFYRVSSPETQGIGGTGLGLHITRSLVELQGGAIWIDSAAGQGSTFSFSLPLAKHAMIQPLPALLAADAQHRMILLVEPRAALARLLQGYLEQGGYTVEVVEAGQAALARAGQVRPALVALDIQLPDMDGYALLEQLRADPRTTAIPVIAIAGIENAARALELGISYISEPIDERSLLDVVHATLAEDHRSIALVVDDDPQIAQMLAALLAQRGYNAFVATDGQQGLTLATRLRPSLVLLDLWMPRLNGFQVLNVLRQHPATRGIPVIALNDSDIASSALRRVLALGAIDLITKPPDLELLQRLVLSRLELLALTEGHSDGR